MKGVVGFVIVWTLLSGIPVLSAPLLFEFSGRFGDCQQPCDDPQLAALAQQEYSGSLLIPAAANELVPDGQNRPFSNDFVFSYYELSGPNAKLNFDTLGAFFDVTDGTPIDTIVGSCETFVCASNQNFVWFQFIDETYTFTLNFGSLPDPADRSIKIPDIDGYADFVYIGFGIHRNDDFTTVSTNELSPTETEMEISISPHLVKPTQVPLGKIPMLLLAILIGTGGVSVIHNNFTTKALRDLWFVEADVDVRPIAV